MDKDRLIELLVTLHVFNKSKDKPLKQAEALKQEVYDICMTEGANTDNYSPDGTTGFSSARSTMQLIYNALLDDLNIVHSHQKYGFDGELFWYGFQFAESELIMGFFRNTLDKTWDLDKSLDEFFEKLKKESTGEPITDLIYKKYVSKNPWLDKVQMSDHDLFDSLKRDIGEKRADSFVYHNHYNKPYDRICINIVKCYYETGKVREVGASYVDAQMEDMCENTLYKSGTFQLWHPKCESTK